jgi:saccharopine dehydrogenase-like NADP-dependent oxidoreductase
MSKIGILGSGKIGKVAAYMISSSQVPNNLTVTLADKVSSDPNVVIVDASDYILLDSFVSTQDAIVNAMPYTMNKFVAESCARLGKSYFDFSEDVATTAFVKNLAHSGSMKPGQVMIPQCGLAPGAINIIAADLIKVFDEVDTLEMRVGALPCNANNEMKYYLSWSSAGLVNEYNNPCDALWRGQHIKVLPLENLEHIVLDGIPYEAFNTSGGVATMCETYEGKICNLDYKTIRYPGHCEHMKFVMHDLGFSNHPERLIQIIEENVPGTSQDVVIIYVNAVGTINGKPHQRSYTKRITHEHGLTAIQRSTAAGMSSVVSMWLNGQLPDGFVKQEDIKFDDFIKTPWGKEVYG